MSKKSFGRSSALIAAGTLVSRILGVARQMLLVYAIGSLGVIANAFATAGRVPNLIYTLIISGALSAVLVPQITKAAQAQDGGSAYINKLITLAGAVGAALTALGCVIAPFMILAMTPGWSHGQKMLALLFALWLLPQVFFFAIFTVAGEVLNARSFFGPYSWAPILNNLVHIASLVIFCMTFGADPDGERTATAWNTSFYLLLAGASTLGTATQALVLFLAFKRAKVHYRPDFKWRGYGLAQIGRVASWTLASVFISQLLGLYQGAAMNRAQADEAGFATSEFAVLIFVLPHAIIVVSLVMASFTRMSELIHAGRLQEFKHQLSRALTLTILTMTFSAVTLSVLAPQLSRVLQPTASTNTVWNVAVILICFLVGLLPFSCVFVLNRGFFALSDTRTPFFTVLGFSIAAFTVASLSFMLPSAHVTWVITLSSSLLYIFQLLALIVLLKRRIGRFTTQNFMSDTVKSLVAGAAAGAAGIAFLAIPGIPQDRSVAVFAPPPSDTPNLSQQPLTEAFVPAIVACASTGLVMLVAFAGCMLLLRHSVALAPVVNKFSRRQRAPHPGGKVSSLDE